MPVPTASARQITYAIGDIHGRLDLLNRLLTLIDADHAARGAGAPTQLVFLGDYIDRGLESSGVIKRLIELAQTRTPKPVFLLGNHEQVLRNILEHGDTQLAGDWLRFGGRECGLSYGVMPPAALSKPALTDFIARLRAAVPQAHRDFLNNLSTSLTVGDYFFCHAGIQPGVPVDAQTEHDLCWSRGPFLASTADHGKIIVHGHTIRPEPEAPGNRIGIDTGAYATGKLTAVVITGNQHRFLQT